MRTVVKIVYFMSLVCSVFAILALFYAVNGSADNGMQQMGAMTFSIGLAAIPYTIARAIDGMTK